MSTKLLTTAARRAALSIAESTASGKPAPTAAEAQARIYDGLLKHQQAFCDDTTHRKLGLVCGFGAGKTHGLVAKAAVMATLNVGYVSALFEPVAPMLRDILQRTMDDLLTEWQIPYQFRVSPLPEYELTFAEGKHTILLRTMETWNRIRGQNLCAIGFDEADTANKRTAEQATRMALARLRAGNVRQFYAATTPEGWGWAYETFERNAGDDTALIRGSSHDNPHLPDDFIPSLEANYPPQLVQAYVMGQWVNLTTGQVYDRFSREVHVVPTDWDELEAETILLGVDFNVTNMSGVLAVRRGRELHVFDEVAGAHDTDALAQEVRRRYPKARILGYPDASGTARSTNSSRSDVAILQSYDISNMAPKANPPVRDRVASVQALLENGKGERRLFIDPRCRRLIECLELQSYDEKGDPDKATGHDHMCFAASTKVATPSGPVAIADLPPSGWILGPFGTPVRYENASRTGKDRPMLSVTLNNGKIVRCTPEHQWLTQHGWMQAKHLTTRHLLLTPLGRSSTANAITCAADTFSAMVCDFIARSGNPSMGRSLTASMFTTLMAIDQTIIPAILRCLQQATTLPNTTSIEVPSFASVGTQALASKCSNLPPNGIEAMLAENGTDCTLSGSEIVFLPDLALSPLARYAATDLSSFALATFIAHGLAPKRQDGSLALTMSSGSAPIAIAFLLSTDTAASADVRARAAFGWVGVTGLRAVNPEDSYCLSSAAGSFMLADGPVVSNCDALGYIVHRCFEVGRASAGKPVRGLRLY